MRRGRLQRCAELVLVTIAAGALPAAAQSPIQVPAGCGSEEELRSEIERLTGEPAAGRMPSALVIEPVQGEPGGYELRLALGDELRILRDPECRILWRSAIVIAAARVHSEPAPPAASEPAAEPDPVPPAPAPSVTPVPPAALEPASNTAAVASRARPPSTSPRQVRRRPRPTRSRRPPPSARARERATPEGVPSAPTPLVAPALGELRAGLGLGVGVSSGILPDVGGVLEIGGRLELLPWAVDAAVRYWPERSESREGRVVDVSGVGARVTGLFRVASALNLIAGIQLTRLVGEGAEGVSGRNADAVWQFGPTLGFSLITWDIRALRLEIGAAAQLSLARPRFVVTGYGDLYRVPPLGADAIIRGVWLFP